MRKSPTENLALLQLQADIGMALVQSESLPAMLQSCAQLLVERLDAAFARVWTLNEDGNVLELKASAGIYTHLDGAHSRVPVGKFKIGLIAQERTAHLTNSVIGDPRVHDQEWAKRERMCAFAGYPLLVENRLVGVMALFSRNPLPASTLSTLSAISNVIALGIERKRNEEALLLAHDELEKQVKQRTMELEREVAERQRAEENLRELTGRLLQLRDDERRRIARELHDSVGQMLVAMSMNQAQVLKENDLSPKARAGILENGELVQQVLREIRTISHLLHPPLLDEAGLRSALQWYVDGFAERSQIAVELDIPDDFVRLPRDLETAAFRIVQECLTNIHRHSGSQTALIRVTSSAREIKIEVSDDGDGMTRDKLQELTKKSGVGIRGMQERVRQLRGSLDISDKQPGTLITAILPLHREPEVRFNSAKEESPVAR